ncbi:class I SAM-dependent methyltransferase [Dermatobacter hominis]|uniref:class I SAM-dependent methyltransferase n=1 Tax=Dermatobacter hominis TaxID=2884263 RepID=UPI001D121E69|nr:class I SAM-dependent methyltransferase [Dermatobacter hominis]UDY37057.1 class I SAM-dependent methyltransferase [Dermatobacter hominis]
MATLFDRLADSYDAVGVDFITPIARGLVDELDPRPGEAALDVGCGKGAALVPLARAVGPSGTAVGIDVSPGMVDRARAAIEEAGTSATVEVGDAMHPEVDGPFDLIASSLVLFFLSDPLAALMAWRPLLREGGRVGVSTFGPLTERWRTTVDAELHRHAPAHVKDARTDGQAGPFSSDAGMEELLRSAGYGDVRTVTTTVCPRFDDPEHWQRFSMSVGQRRFWEAIPPDRYDEVRATLFEAVDACRDDEGRIGFDQAVRYTIASA